MRKHTSSGLARAEQIISSKTIEIQNRNTPIVASLPQNTSSKSNKQPIKGVDKNVINKEETTHLLSTSSMKYQFTFFDHVTSQLKRINYFNILALCAISILTNVIYFNFVYLPGLKGVNDLMLTSRLELPASATDNSDYSVGKYFGSLFALSSLIKFPKLSYSSSSSSSSSSSESSTSKNSDNPQGFQFGISWDHVSYGHMDDAPRPNEPASSQPAFIAGLLDDSKSNMKKSLEARRKESQMALKLALSMQKAGKPNKASKVLKYALSMDPDNPELLAAYGEHLEQFKNDIVAAEHFYRRAVSYEPEHVDANLNLRRATPIVSKIDRQMLNTIDELLKLFYEIPSTNSALRHAKKEAYFMHIYHSNAIEGNTLNLHQTRHILENRMSVGGKSVQEHNEVLGLDAAMKYINQTLLYKPLNEFTVEDIKEIHRRVLGYCDPIESGQFRKHQVYVGKFTPPGPEKVEEEMNKFVEWLNSNQLQLAHPIQIATLVHYKFVYIHPFYDGNGRTGRLLMNLILMKFGYPPIIILKEQRLEYYECLIKGNQGDLKPLVRFIARCTQRTLKDYIDQCNRSNKLGADDPKKLIRSDLVTTEDDYFLEKSPITRQQSALTATITDNADLNDDKDDLDDNIDTISDNLVNTGKFSFVRQDDYESNDQK